MKTPGLVRRYAKGLCDFFKPPIQAVVHVQHRAADWRKKVVVSRLTDGRRQVSNQFSSCLPPSSRRTIRSWRAYVWDKGFVRHLIVAALAALLTHCLVCVCCHPPVTTHPSSIARIGGIAALSPLHMFHHTGHTPTSIAKNGTEGRSGPSGRHHVQSLLLVNRAGQPPRHLTGYRSSGLPRTCPAQIRTLPEAG